MNEASSESRKRIGRAISSGEDTSLERRPLLELIPGAGEVEGGGEHGRVDRTRADRVDPEALGR